MTSKPQQFSLGLFFVRGPVVVDYPREISLG